MGYYFNTIQWFKQKIATIGWFLFIWGNDFTEEEYWGQIYEQEKRYHENIQD
jgi:hypothetical protein